MTSRNNSLKLAEILLKKPTNRLKLLSGVAKLLI